MSKKLNGHDRSENKIVNFPGSKERQKLKSDEEKRIRAEYKKRKKEQSEPFINYDKIPLFARTFFITLLLINLPIFFLGSAQQLSIIHNFGFTPGVFTGIFEWSWLAPLTLFTHIALHGGFMHLGFNLVMGLALSIAFERQYGARAAFKFFIISCLGGALLFFLISPFSPQALIGASGGISGLFGALLLNILRQLSNQPQVYSAAAIANGQHALKQRTSKILKKKGPWPILIFWGLFMTLIGLITPGNISWSAHLGGYITGITLVILIEKRKIKL